MISTQLLLSFIRTFIQGQQYIYIRPRIVSKPMPFIFDDPFLRETVFPERILIFENQPCFLNFRMINKACSNKFIIPALKCSAFVPNGSRTMNTNKSTSIPDKILNCVLLFISEYAARIATHIVKHNYIESL